MTKRMAVLHTSFVFTNVEPVFKDLFKELIPDVEVIDFVDSHILADVRRAGKVESPHIQRMCYMAQAAEAARADLIFSACSSLGPSMDVARKLVNIPIIKIDDAMTQRAVELGSTIGVMATVPTTLQPTVDLIQQWAQLAGKPVEVKKYLCEGAFDVLMGVIRASMIRWCWMVHYSWLPRWILLFLPKHLWRAWHPCYQRRQENKC
jgi:hypothetical protein